MGVSEETFRQHKARHPLALSAYVLLKKPPMEAKGGEGCLQIVRCSLMWLYARQHWT
jgi:hypothetical protein